MKSVHSYCIYMRLYESLINWDVVTINKDSIRVVILPGIDYKKIDKLFKKKSIVQVGNMGNFTIDYYEYKIADCKVLIEDLVNTNK